MAIFKASEELPQILRKKRNFFIVVGFIAILFLATIIRDYIKYNNFVCQTKKLELREVVIYVSGRANDVRILSDKHQKPYSLNTWKVLYNKGFPENHIEIKAGDSIIKKSGSKEITIKRGKKIAVYELNCDDW
jgi:hypothetical protein